MHKCACMLCDLCMHNAVTNRRQGCCKESACAFTKKCSPPEAMMSSFHESSDDIIRQVSHIQCICPPTTTISHPEASAFFCFLFSLVLFAYSLPTVFIYSTHQAGLSAERLSSTSSSSSGMSSWVASMSAAWRHLGVGSAKGPLEGTSTKEIKDNITWEVSGSISGRGGPKGLERWGSCRGVCGAEG